MRMMIDADTGIERKPSGQILPEIDVSGHLVHRFVGGHAVGVAVQITVPRLAAEMLVIESERDAIAVEKA